MLLILLICSAFWPLLSPCYNILDAAYILLLLLLPRNISKLEEKDYFYIRVLKLKFSFFHGNFLAGFAGSRKGYDDHLLLLQKAACWQLDLRNLFRLFCLLLTRKKEEGNGKKM